MSAEGEAVVVARGPLGRVRELERLLRGAGIACELLSPGPGARHG